MDLEQIIFLVIALLLSVFSMYRKSKKRQQSLPKEEKEVEYEPDFPFPPETYYPPESVVIYEQYVPSKLSENENIYTKKNKKEQKSKNLEVINFQTEKSKKILQDADLESNIILLEDFEGTEIQKAFLYSEIFKKPVN